MENDFFCFSRFLLFQESELVHVLSLAQDLEIKGLSDPSSANNKGQLASIPKIKQFKAIDSGSKKTNFPTKKNQSIPTAVLNSSALSDPVHEQVQVKQELQAVPVGFGPD